MLSAESQVDVTLGLWKNIGVTSLLFISVRSVGSEPVGKFDSANWPNVAPCRGSSQWSSPWKSDLEWEWNVQKRSSEGTTTTAHETWRARCEDDCFTGHKHKLEPREKNSRVRKW